MRVLTVVTEAPPVRSGVALTVEQIGGRLEERGHVVDMVTAADVGRVSFGEVRLTGLARHWARIRQQILDADIVNLHGPAPSFSDVFLALWRTVPRNRRPQLVYTHHCEIDLPSVGALCGAYGRAHWRLARAASHVIVSTDSYRRMAEAHGARDISIVAHGLPDHSVPRLPKGPRFTVAFVGQLRPYKGAEVLLRAAVELPDIDFDIVGSGHQEDQLRALATRLGLTNVRWLGQVSDVERDRVLARAHVVCLPSLTKAEAFGIVLLEGMRAGAVPVASDLPGVRDVAGSTGLLCAPGEPRSLVQALVQLRDDPNDWKQRSWLSKRVAARYQWDSAAAQYERIFATCLGRPELAAQPQPQLLPLWAMGRMVERRPALTVHDGGLAPVLRLSLPATESPLERAMWPEPVAAGADAGGTEAARGA